MTKKELRKVELLMEVVNGVKNLGEAALALGVSKRHARRLKSRLLREGPSGLSHRSRGRFSGRALTQTAKQEICRLLQDKYQDFGPTLASEYLMLQDGIKVSREKIRQLQVERGLWKPKRRREGRCHPQRPRRSRMGTLIQIDGSLHRWLEDRAPRFCLMVMIDDATSRVMAARFVKSETTADYMHLLQGYIQSHGLPEAIYSDKLGVFRQNNGDARCKGRLTQLGRALKELEIELICANTPQAKGRVERLFGTLQDCSPHRRRMLIGPWPQR